VSWLQLELRATPDTLPVVEQALLECGAVSLTLVSDADEPVLEPAPGETPLWSNVRVMALFDLATDMSEVRATLAAHDLLNADLQVEFVPAADWQSATRSHAVNQIFGERLWVLPKELQIDAGTGTSNDSALVQLRLDPGLAFGSGAHPTTRMCLGWLSRHVQTGQRVLDFGCGSGILAIAAALLGARVVAVDHDAQAVMATRDNAAYNGVDEAQLEVLSLQEWQREPRRRCFDVIVANILAGPLCSLAAEFEQALVPGGALILSGVLAEQANDVMSSYTATQFDRPETEAGWACLTGRLTQATHVGR